VTELHLPPAALRSIRLFSYELEVVKMNRIPNGLPAQPQLLKRKESLGKRLVALPERFWDWVIDTVDINHDELLAFFRSVPRKTIFKRSKN
jgi:hypothetical protein